MTRGQEEAREQLAKRLAKAYGANPRDWWECQTAEREAHKIVAGLSDLEVAQQLAFRFKH